MEKNKTLVHLDLCSNKFRFEECQDIAEGLKSNLSIYGIHFEGNFGYIDSEGYLVLEDSTKDISSEHITRKIDSVNIQSNFKKFKTQDTPAKNYCWICDGWVEMKFSFTKGKVIA